MRALIVCTSHATRETHEDERPDTDAELHQLLRHSIAIGCVDARRHDFVFIAGGWDASYDLGTSAELGRVITAVRANGAALGAVCQGPLGLLESESASRDVFAHHVVVDGTLATGQNQSAGSEVAYGMMELRIPGP